MGTWRRPKGTYVRPTADWFTDRAATVGGAFDPNAVLATTLDLYNNATDGTNLHVYRLWGFNDAAGHYGVTTLKGHGANFMRNASPVIVGNPILPGQLYQDTIPPQYSGFLFPFDTPFSDVLFADNEAGSQDTFAAPGPICVIPPGYSLRVYSLCGSGQTHGQMMTASFYFLALPDSG
jgi:hypothetical protein